jgi:hypothetical protein
MTGVQLVHALAIVVAQMRSCLPFKSSAKSQAASAYLQMLSLAVLLEQTTAQHKRFYTALPNIRANLEHPSFSRTATQ